MENFILILILLPIVAFFITNFLPTNNEKNIHRVVLISVLAHLGLSFFLIIIWFINKCTPIEYSGIEVYSTSTASFHIQFWVDAVSASFGLMGSLISVLIAFYSKTYMHKENGYKRFFCTILFFILGFNIVVYSGNFETLFFGWEILGVSSFLLIAFYRERYMPVKNAMKVFFFYRIADIGIIMAMWISHHIFEQNISFHNLADYVKTNQMLNQHALMSFFVSGIIVIVAMIKSGQLPFSFWLPRAMEGPTPSSAIFYGSLSAHIGVFLLLRTSPIWEHELSIRIFLAIVGVATSIISLQISKVQSSIKSKIAYMSISQIGFMFVEISLIDVVPYMKYFVLFHFTGNAMLRTYQLLISPSSVSSLIKFQYFSNSNLVSSKYLISEKWHNTIYLLGMKEWNLELISYQYFWQPLKKSGKMFDFLSLKSVLYLTIPIMIFGILMNNHQIVLPEEIIQILPYFYQIIALCLCLKAFVERKNINTALVLLFIYPLFNILSISINSAFNIKDVMVYLLSVLFFGSLILLIFNKLKKKIGNISLYRFWGLVNEYKTYHILFLIGILGLMGFPPSPIFLAVDVIFSHIEGHQWLLMHFAATSFTVNALALIRIYSKIFMGEPLKIYK